MSVIQIIDLTFYYDGSYDNIFENVSFQIDTDWRLGFIGRNGRGKTTFLNLLQNKYEYKGTITASVEFDYFPFEIADQSKFTMDVVEEVCPGLEDWRLSIELQMLQVPDEVLNRPFQTLSNGERTKILLAALFLRENNFLLIDEPTNHLDMEARKVVAEYLKKKKGFILVSHDRLFLDECTDHILAINKTNIEVVQGNFSSWWREKENQDQFEIQQDKKLKNEIKRLSEAAKRNEDWSNQLEKTKIGTHAADRGAIGHKAAKMMKRSKVVESHVQRAVDEKSELLHNIETVDDLKIIPLKHYNNRLVEIKNLSLAYDGHPILEDFQFFVQNGQRIALQGKNGSGKSSILKLLLGEITNRKGSIEMASGIKISYVPQDTSFLSGSLNDFIFEHQLDETLFKAILRKLDFSRVQFEKRLESYSGGQKKKVLIAKSLCEQAHLYLWDEPLNFIDLFSRIQLQNLILKYQPTFVFVEHDKAFVDAVATDCCELGL